jgi:hypothetical protein
LKFITFLFAINQTECWIFLQVGCKLWLMWRLNPSFCNLSFRFRMRCWFCWHSWDRRRVICCSFLIPFFSFPLLSFSLNLQYLWCCLRKIVCFRCGTSCLFDDTKSTVVFGLGFFFLFTPAERPVRFASGIVVDLNAGLIGLADVILVSTVHCMV